MTHPHHETSAGAVVLFGLCFGTVMLLIAMFLSTVFEKEHRR